MKVLITGGAGFIGGHLAESLLADNHDVIAVDDLSTGSLDNLKNVAQNPHLHFVKGDITDNAFDLDSLIRGADAVVHLAAAVGVELVVKEPVRTIRTNVHGTERVLEPCAKYRKRVIVASTSEVYGKSQAALFKETDDLLIGCSTFSRWGYACSKLLDEFYVMAFCRECALPGTVVRFFNTVGPRQTGQYGMVIPRFVAHAVKNEPLQVYGDGNQSRCFCHVFDTVRALRGLLENKESYGKIYNIGGQRRISIMELAKLVIRETGSSSKIELIPYEKAYAAGFEDMQRRAPDTDAVKALIGWEPKYTLEQVIADVKASQEAK